MPDAVFFSSFEAGEPQPAGFTVDSGPRRSPTAKTGVGFTGLRALRYEGQVDAVLFDVDVPV
ncbi:MAG TPA: hypothetical protein VJX66_08975, partial [Amycolatopsis sp.]|nr:hypothetical protein [Amycolatopsis sp.]